MILIYIVMSLITLYLCDINEFHTTINNTQNISHPSIYTLLEPAIPHVELKVLVVVLCNIILLLLLLVWLHICYTCPSHTLVSTFEIKLKELRIHTFKIGDTYECCAICMEIYLEGNEIRVLPCSHAFQCKCIDPWLTKCNRVCPLCLSKVFSEYKRHWFRNKSLRCSLQYAEVSKPY